MNNRKSQNSILILTTLGVYLGLVLVGATPQVIAQSLTFPEIRQVGPCHQLELKVREREAADLWFKDRNVIDYVGLLEELLRVLPENRLNQVDWNWVSINGEHASVETLGGPPVLVPIDLKKDREKIENTVDFVASGFSADQFEFRFKRSDIETVSRLQTNVKGIDPQRAEVPYSLALDLWRCEGGTELDKLILKNTEITIEDKNLVIITRLPRGSLDSLLAKDAK